MISTTRITSLLPGLPRPPIDFIRYRVETQQVSIIDVVRVITGADSRHTKQRLSSITRGGPEAQKIVLWKFPGERQRETPVCDAETMTMIVMQLPGKWAAKLRVQFARIICAAMAGQLVQRVGLISPEERSFWAGTVASSAEDMLEWREDRNTSKQSHNAKIAALKGHDNFKASRWDLVVSAASTSRAVIGQYPKQFKLEMGLAPNCSARDYMTREQLVTVTMIDSHMNEWIRDNSSCTRVEMRAHHDAVSQSFFAALRISGQHDKHLTAQQGRNMKRKLSCLERTMAQIESRMGAPTKLDPTVALPRRKGVGGRTVARIESRVAAPAELDMAVALPRRKGVGGRTMARIESRMEAPAELDPVVALPQRRRVGGGLARTKISSK